jgi:2'-hydroxyisoflavone reductase
LALPFACQVASESASEPASRAADEPSTESRRGRGKKLLILGGTRFLGPAVVAAAMAKGFEITLFNRGKSAPDMFPELELIKGDRDLDELDGLRDRSWDMVVDTSGYVPRQVRASAEVLKGNIGCYAFISTVSVYADQSPEIINEDAPVATVEPAVVARIRTIRQSFVHYGAMKALCEQAAESVLPGQVANVRPGLIVGPRDSSDRFTYWPVRVKRGGEILAPGDPNGEVQFIDVRDLANWVVDLCDREQAGTFNAVGFEGRMSMQELLHGCKIVLGANDARFTWVSDEFLRENKVRPYTEMPLYLPEGTRGHFDVSSAFAHGLRTRPVGDTIKATVEWHEEDRPEHVWRSAGMREARENELLAKWRQRQGK